MKRGARRLTLLSLAAVAGLSVLFDGCESDTSCPPGSGRIYGTILAPGDSLPAATDIYAERIESDFNANAHADSTGSFSIPVISGSYRISLRMLGPAYIEGYLQAPSGMTSELDRATIYRVPSGGAVRTDVVLGAVRITIRRSQDPERRWIYSELRGSDGARWPLNRYDEIEGDSATLPPAFAPSGRYRIAIYLGNIGPIWCPGTYSESGAAWIDLAPAEETAAEVTLGPPVILRGTFTGAWREVGEERMDVHLIEVESGSTIATELVRSDTFGVSVLAPVQALLRIDWHDIKRWQGGDSEAEATIFDLRSGDTTRVGLIDSGIAGEIGQAGPAVLTIHDSTGTMLTHVGVTGSTGSFSFLNLTPGRRYYIQFHGEAGRWNSQWYGGGASFDSAAPIVIAHEGDLMRIEFNIH
jgi:hypothetical protein